MKRLLLAAAALVLFSDAAQGQSYFFRDGYPGRDESELNPFYPFRGVPLPPDPYWEGEVPPEFFWEDCPAGDLLESCARFDSFYDFNRRLFFQRIPGPPASGRSWWTARPIPMR